MTFRTLTVLALGALAFWAAALLAKAWYVLR